MYFSLKKIPFSGDAQDYRDILEFGHRHKAAGLAETVSDLYDAALKAQEGHTTLVRGHISHSCSRLFVILRLCTHLDAAR